MDQILVDRLAIQKPMHWAKTIRRHIALTDYEAAGEGSLAAMEEGASKLGISMRRFYGLLAQYRADLAGAPIVAKQKGDRRRIDPACEALIQKIMVDLGPSATEREIVSNVVGQRLRAKLPYVSTQTIKLRVDDIASRARLKRTFESACDYLLDACALNLWIRTDDGTDEVAHIIGLFDVREGALISHRLVAGRPSAPDVCEFAPSASRFGVGKKLRLCCTRALAAFDDELRVSIDAESVSFSTDGYVAGFGFRSLYGRAIGEIDSYNRFRDRLPPSEGVSYTAAATVIAQLIHRHSLEP
ncbi:hypothetical protein M2333_003103 [Sphingobium sp. B11D3B]|uniref:hypothetical protein n=1 Tax=Sphingobium sp. B11D3B TaxID=2940575 RepID=UPI002227F851|nr:hypothetical protein [Sphingobium sp. B11D3B]MCW2390057.1 hypothetical protein [Sphingobium sp. B11D3B]